MLNRLVPVAAVGAALLLVSACSDTSEFGAGSEPDPAPQETTDVEDEADDAADSGDAVGDADQAEAAEELAADEEESDEDFRFVVQFDEPFVHEDGGIRLSITGLGITDATSDQMPSDVAEFLDDGVTTVLVLEMTASNDSGEQVNFYPDQGTIQVLREQVEADLWFSDSVAGMDWRDGVDSNGQVFWMLSSPFEDVVAAGELAYVASAPHDSESWDNVADDFELTVTW